MLSKTAVSETEIRHISELHSFINNVITYLFGQIIVFKYSQPSIFQDFASTDLTPNRKYSDKKSYRVADMCHIVRSVMTASVPHMDRCFVVIIP